MSVYITIKQPPKYKQMTLEDLLFGDFYDSQHKISSNYTNTRTYVVEQIPEKFLSKINVDKMIETLKEFNNSTANLRTCEDRHSLYTTFYIPKHSGGLRKIDAPNAELMDALRRLKTIFEDDFNVLYHTSAFAYIKGRCAVDAVKRHQYNQSKWFAKLDLHNFFGSTTLDYVVNNLSMIFPFSEIMKRKDGKHELVTALELGFLDGGLPQGTPLSPTLTNIMMIPVDYKLSSTFRNLNNQKFINTRYADDFQISSRYAFNVSDVEKTLCDILSEFNAPFTINKSKTRYGSSAGRNWNLGVMLNKDNEITVGHKKKKIFKSMLHNYITDRSKGVVWSLEDIRTLLGLYAYYRSVEQENIDALIEYVNRKHDTDVIRSLNCDLLNNHK